VCLYTHCQGQSWKLNQTHQSVAIQHKKGRKGEKWSLRRKKQNQPQTTTYKKKKSQNFPGCQTARWVPAAGSLGDLEEAGNAYQWLGLRVKSDPKPVWVSWHLQLFHWYGWSYRPIWQPHVSELFFHRWKHHIFRETVQKCIPVFEIAAAKIIYWLRVCNPKLL